jgi:methyl-accepting chemotaxis protein
MSGFSIRLTHKVMAIGVAGLAGLLAFGAIYQTGSWSQDTSRVVAVEGRALSTLNQHISIEMLEARRAEKDFMLRRDESYLKHHAGLSAAIDRDLEKLKAMAGWGCRVHCAQPCMKSKASSRTSTMQD